jgi:uncharacterized protein YbaR (Trm112 family)
MDDSKKINEGTQYNKDDNILEPIDNLCCICYNKSLTLFLNCNHIICLECITNIKKLCCPLCRTDLSYLPKKIINIINSDSTSTSTGNNNYLSLLNNVRPLSLSSNLGLSSLSNNPSLLSISSNLQPLPLSMSLLNNFHTTDSRIDNDLSIYEQYFNELSFIDIDDIIHYGFINGRIENNSDRNGDRNSDRNSDRNGKYN